MTAHDADPSVTDWHEATATYGLTLSSQEMSTSAHLRMQLAAALHDAEHLARERDEARAHADRLTLRRPTPHLDSVKAELAKTQADLAASQADLTAALAKLNTFREAVDEKVQATHRQFVEVCAERGRLKDNERRWAGEVEYAERERDIFRSVAQGNKRHATYLQAALDKAERERDEARAATADVEKHRKLTAEQRDRAEVERDEALEIRNAAVDGFININDRLTEANKERDLARAELASARQELEKLRPIADAARAYVMHPALPPTRDPNEAHAWDQELMQLDNTLRNAVLKGGTP